MVHDLEKKVDKMKYRKYVPDLTSLASYPANFHVYGQNKNEIILLFIREKKVMLVLGLILRLFIYLLALLLPLILNFILNITIGDIYEGYLDDFFGSKYWYLIIVLWTAFMLRYVLNSFLHWFYNINILTNQRFMDINLAGIFNVRVEETDLLTIEDVKDSQSGILQSIFNMGSLEVLTASSTTRFNLENVDKSHKVRDFIMDVVISQRNLFRGDDSPRVLSK